MHRVRAWVAQNYQKPAIDQEWLADCSDWLSSELGLHPSRDFDQFIQHVEAQLLQSNLADSTIPGSGIDPLLFTSNTNPARPRPRPSSVPRTHQASRPKKTTGSIPLLVEIKSITEIAHSAFSLLNTHQTRLDREDLGLAQEENAEQHRDEDDGPVPRFLRGMLRFELSDGLTTFRAIEFRSLPQLELGTTPLGYKMLLESTPIRNGIAFLEPANVTLKGYRTEDHDINSEQVFLSSLRKRLGRSDPPSDAPVAAQPRVNPPDQSVPAQPARQHQLPPVVQPQAPPADIDGMYIDDDVDPDVAREMAVHMDEAIDTKNQRVGICAPPPARPPPSSKEKPAVSSNPKQALRLDTTVASSSLNAPSTSSTVKTSPYFTAHSPESKPIPDIGLSPRPAPPPNPELDFGITWDVDDPELSKLPVKKLGSTSARPPSTTPAKRVISPEKRPTSPDPYDDLSFDMDVDESFFEQVGMIEEGALGADTNNTRKDKGKDTCTEGTTSHSRPSAASTRNRLSGSVVGTNFLVKCPVSPSGAELSTRMQGSAKRVTIASSLSGSTESPMPQCTRSSDHRLPRDPSLIVISSEDEVLGGDSTARPLNLARRRAHKRRKMDQDQVADSDVINISD
ncbi:hypothetical protein J3R82DRAFT_11781 [Butyriboletus roseoflavus]|nr:hypothetical protein J3R82DRAFT_11781 [Butyriboletus roseoflavus]